MLLLPDFVRFPNEIAKFFIQVRWLINSEVMDVIVLRNRVDAHETRAVMSLSEDQMPDVTDFGWRTAAYSLGSAIMVCAPAASLGS